MAKKEKQDKIEKNEEEVKISEDKNEIALTDKEEVKEENNVPVEEKKFDSEKANKQIKWIVIVMIILIGGIIVGFWVSNEIKKTYYIGLTFQKEMFGDIPIYTTPIQGYSVNGQPMDFKLALRKNPKDSSVPFEGNLNILANKDLLVSFNMTSNLNTCGDAYVLTGFGRFAAELGIAVKTGAVPKEYAKEHNQTYIDCKNSMNNTVMILTEGNITKIQQQKDYPSCYILYLKRTDKGCETLDVVERFEIAMLAGLTGEDLPEPVEK
ncbi:MAG: hypothetical protein WC781_04220 [Candidatus Pacearchaeota archaeon]|jgi:hypothetical protein